MPPPSPRLTFAAALLAGGRSSRMGEDKAFLLWKGGLPLWKVQLAKLEGFGPAQRFIAGREDQVFEVGGFRVLPDAPGESGPLQALLRCMVAERMPVLVLGVDLPLMTEEVLAFVLDHSHTERGFVFERDGFYEPMAALYPVTMVEHLNAARATGRMQEALRAGVAAGVMQAAPLPKGFERAFFNANTPDEWKQAQQSR